MLIRNLHLQTPQPDQLRSFYAERLGLQAVTADTGDLCLRAGESLLAFRKSETPAYYHFAFNIPFDRMQEARLWLEDRVRLLPYMGKTLIDFPNWKAQSLYFLDPAGNILEFIGRKDRGPAKGPGFSPACIENISEIGLPVEDVEKAVALLVEKERMPQYSGSGPVFRALGDPQGLLIMVNMRTKTWFPTDKPARAFPLRARVDLDRRTLILRLGPEGRLHHEQEA